MDPSATDPDPDPDPARTDPSASANANVRDCAASSSTSLSARAQPSDSMPSARSDAASATIDARGAARSEMRARETRAEDSPSMKTSSTKNVFSASSPPKKSRGAAAAARGDGRRGDHRRHGEVDGFLGESLSFSKRALAFEAGIRRAESLCGHVTRQRRLRRGDGGARRLGERFCFCFCSRRRRLPRRRLRAARRRDGVGVEQRPGGVLDRDARRVPQARERGEVFRGRERLQRRETRNRRVKRRRGGSGVGFVGSVGFGFGSRLFHPRGFFDERETRRDRRDGDGARRFRPRVSRKNKVAVAVAVGLAGDRHGNRAPHPEDGGNQMSATRVFVRFRFRRARVSFSFSFFSFSFSFSFPPNGKPIPKNASRAAPSASSSRPQACIAAATRRNRRVFVKTFRSRRSKSATTSTTSARATFPTPSSFSTFSTKSSSRSPGRRVSRSASERRDESESFRINSVVVSAPTRA